MLRYYPWLRFHKQQWSKRAAPNVQSCVWFMFADELLARASNVAKSRVNVGGPGTGRYDSSGPLMEQFTTNVSIIVLLILMAIIGLEEKFLIMLSEHFRIHSGMKICSQVPILPKIQLKHFVHFSIKTTLHPEVLVNFLYPALSVVITMSESSYILVSLSLPSCVHWISPFSPSHTFCFGLKHQWDGKDRGKRIALRKKMWQG